MAEQLFDTRDIEASVDPTLPKNVAMRLCTKNGYVDLTRDGAVISYQGRAPVIRYAIDPVKDKDLLARIKRLEKHAPKYCTVCNEARVLEEGTTCSLCAEKEVSVPSATELLQFTPAQRLKILAGWELYDAVNWWQKLGPDDTGFFFKSPANLADAILDAYRKELCHEG